MNAVFEFLTSLTGVWTYCGLLFIFALYHALKLLKQCREIRHSLTAANNELKKTDGETGFAANYEEVNNSIKSNSLLGHVWSEFSETLVFLETSDSDSGDVIKNSHEASEFFNDRSIISPRLSVRFYNAFPNYLTGLGILGTFIGLAVGIHLAGPKLDSQQISDVKEGLSNLLSGASLAFITSICGLISSILFSVFEKKQLNNIHNLLIEWNRLLNERLKRVTTESIANEQLKEVKKQTNLLERFNTDLAVSIANALDEKMANRLGPSMEALIDAVNKLREDRGETNQKLLTNLLEEFKTSLSGSVGSEMSGIGNTLGKLNETLSITLKSISDEQLIMKETTKKLTYDLTTAIKQNNQTMHEDTSRLMDEILSSLKKASETMAANMASAGQQASDNMTDIINMFSQSVKKLVDTTSQTDSFLSGIREVLSKTDQFCNTLQDTHQSLKEVVEPLRLSADSIHASSLQTVESMQAIKDVAGKLAQHHESIEETHQYLTRAWESYCARFENVDSSLQLVFEKIQNSLSAYTSQFHSFVKELDGHTSKSLKDLGGVIEELGNNVELLQTTAELIADSNSGIR